MFDRISLNTTRISGSRWTSSKLLSRKSLCCTRISLIPLVYQRWPSTRFTASLHLSLTTYNAPLVVIVISLRRPSISTGVPIPRPLKHEITSNGSLTIPAVLGFLSSHLFPPQIHEIRGFSIPNKASPLTTHHMVLPRRRTSVFSTSSCARKIGLNGSTAIPMRT